MFERQAGLRLENRRDWWGRRLQTVRIITVGKLPRWDREPRAKFGLDITWFVGKTLLEGDHPALRGEVNDVRSRH
jgi:hypothetical protein